MQAHLKREVPGIGSAMVSDDDEFFRIAMRNILSKQLGVAEVVETSSFDDAIECLASGDGVGLALLDLNMPGMDTRNSIRTVRKTFPATRLAVISASRNRRDILRCLEAGAHGYVYKGSGAGSMANALRQICAGAVYVPPFLPELAGDEEIAPEAETRDDRDEQVFQRLTRRQREVLELLVGGMSNKGIARKLSLSEGAVKFHLSALFGHLGVTNRVQAATYGARVLKAEDRGNSWRAQGSAEANPADARTRG